MDGISAYARRLRDISLAEHMKALTAPEGATRFAGMSEGMPDADPGLSAGVINLASFTLASLSKC